MNGPQGSFMDGSDRGCPGKPARRSPDRRWGAVAAYRQRQAEECRRFGHVSGRAARRSRRAGPKVGRLQPGRTVTVPCGSGPPKCRTKLRAASTKRCATPERPLPMRCQARRKRWASGSTKAWPARGKCLIGSAGLCQGRKRLRQAQSSLSDLLERQPLVLGAVGLAIGATVAGALASPVSKTSGSGI